MGIEGQNIEIPEKDKPEDPGRRRFIGDAAKTAIGIGIVGSGAAHLIEKLTDDEDSGEENVPLLSESKKAEVEDTEETQETNEKPIVLSPIEQLEAYSKIKDLEKGVDIIYSNHLNYLLNDEKGREDMRRTANNIAKLPMDKIAEKYKEQNLPEELAYMVMIQETRARDVTSNAGARGYTGLMPKTIKALGYKPEAAKHPVKANEITAKYFAIERDDRFGNDMPLNYSAYNAGGGLHGYTKTEKSKKDRSSSGFYEYMEDKINVRYAILKKYVNKKHYFPYKFKKRDKTLTHLCKRLDVSLDELLAKNKFTKSTIIHPEQEIKIPCTDPIKAAEIDMKGYFETIRYYPEIRAKYTALKKLGYLNQIQLAMK